MNNYRKLLPYGVALGTTAIALFLTFLMAPFLTQSIAIFFFVAITITIWYGGLRPGFVAIILSALAINRFFVPSAGQILNLTISDFLRLLTFSSVGIVTHLFSSSLRESQRQVEKLNQQLLDENADRLKAALNKAQTSQTLLQQQFEQQRLVMEIAQRIRQSLNLEDILQTAVDEVRQLLQTDRVVIFRFFPDWRGCVVVESCGDDWTKILSTEIHDPCFGENYVEPFKQGLVTAKADIYTAGIGECHLELLSNLQVRANLVVPIMKSDELWGLLIAHHCAAPRHWQDPEISLLQQIAAQVGLALQQSALFEQVQAELVERIQVEEALRRSEAELEQRVAERTEELNALNNRLLIALKEQHQAKQEVEDLYNTAPCGYHSLDAEGTIIRINDTELKWLGYTREEVLNQMKFTDIITPASQQTFHESFPKFKEQGWIADVEFQLCQKDGSTRWVNLSATALKDNAGNFLMSRSSMFDISDRKQAEQTLALQAVITRSMAEGICLVKDDATILYANPKFEQMFGYDSGELNGQAVSILNYETQTVTAEASARSIINTVLQSREATYEVHNVKKDGTPFWCRATCSVFNHPDYGDVLVAVQQDITNSKQTEAALQQQAKLEVLRWEITQTIRQSLEIKTILDTATEQMRQTLQVDRVAVYRFQADWRGDFIAEAVCDPWVKLVSSDIQTVWEDTYLQETQGGRFQNNETFVIADIYTAGLQPCHIELLEQFQAKAYAVAPIFLGKSLWGLLAIYQNATARNWESWEVELLQQIASQLAIAIQQSKLYNQLQLELQERQQTEAVLREAERRWRLLLEDVQLIVVGLDIRGNVEYINPFFLALTGYSLEEVLEKSWFDSFTHPSQKLALERIFQEILERDLHPHHQNAIVTKLGEERMIAWSNTVLQDTAGKAIGTISIGEDITERYKVDRMKAEFISVVSHELRTPLTSMQAALSLLNEKIIDPLSEEGEVTIQIATEGTDRLVRLVNDILDLERLESGKVRLEKHLCNIDDLVTTAVAQMREMANQAEIMLDVSSYHVQVAVDGDRLIQILTNLLSNAVKFSPQHSVVRLSVEQQESENNSSFLLFAVHDEGRGIPADKLESIFDRFHQIDASDSREKGGTGLGLAICRSIVRQHGGEIWAESIIGEGSTVYFTIPMDKEKL